jgi:NitT/TauT family transport system ATP-binding protein
MAAGLMPPSAGTVFYRGEKVPEPNTRVGFMAQRDTLLPWRSVEDNVAIVLELRGQDRATRTRAAPN